MPRIFLALWPDEAVREALVPVARMAADAGDGRAVEPGKFHLTLAFLGSVGADRVEVAAQIAGSSPFEALDLALDRVGTFRRARVAWIGASRPPPELAESARVLAAALAREGFALESRPFLPHLSVARRIESPFSARAVEPVRWHARELALVESDLRRGVYVVRHRWERDAGAR